MRKNVPYTKPGIPLKDFAQMTGDERLALLSITRETVVSVVRETIANTSKDNTQREATADVASVAR